MKKNISVSVIVPAYNEEGNIEAAISGVIQEVKKTTENYEIVVVNDGSTDKTAQIVKQKFSNNKHVILIDRKINFGLAYTFLEGLKNAKKDYITVFHGDNDASPVTVRQMITNAYKADIISTYPAHKRSRSIPRI